MVLSAVATTSMSSTTMNEASALNASTHRCVDVNRTCFLLSGCPTVRLSRSGVGMRGLRHQRPARLVGDQIPARAVSLPVRGTGPEGRCEDATVTEQTEQLLDRARAGDGEAFAELVEPYRRELHVHLSRPPRHLVGDRLAVPLRGDRWDGSLSVGGS